MKIVLLVNFMLITTFCSAQEISKYVIGTAGGHDKLTSANIDLHWTIGEITGSLISNEQIQLQQGFHQTDLRSVPVYEWNESAPPISVFPNPTSGILSISQEELNQYNIQVRDVYGRILLKDVLKNLETEIDLSRIADQTLLLTIESEARHLGFKIVKISH